MKTSFQDATMTLLRVVPGLVVLKDSAIFVFGAHSAEQFARTGMPGVVRPVLGWVEIIAAVLFLVPRTTVVGGWSLVAVFAAAMLLHVAHGDPNVGGLLVLTTAVLAVLGHRRTRGPGVATATN